LRKKNGGGATGTGVLHENFFRGKKKMRRKGGGDSSVGVIPRAEGERVRGNWAARDGGRGGAVEGRGSPLYVGKGALITFYRSSGEELEEGYLSHNPNLLWKREKKGRRKGERKFSSRPPVHGEANAEKTTDRREQPPYEKQSSGPVLRTAKGCRTAFQDSFGKKKRRRHE